MFLGEKGETQVFGLPKFWEKISEGKKKERKRKKEKKERKERKERRREEGMMAGDGRRSPVAAGVGRSWPEKAAKAPSPSHQVGCKYSSF